jgi:DNA topoisomerase IB
MKNPRPDPEAAHSARVEGCAHRARRLGAAAGRRASTRRGGTQYLYHPRFRAQREEEKFRRVVEFGESLPALRRRVRADLKAATLDRQRVLASMVRLIDQGFFRIGNDKSAKSESTYGLSTIR